MTTTKQIRCDRCQKDITQNVVVYAVSIVKVTNQGVCRRAQESVDLCDPCFSDLFVGKFAEVHR